MPQLGTSGSVGAPGSNPWRDPARFSSLEIQGILVMGIMVMATGLHGLPGGENRGRKVFMKWFFFCSSAACLVIVLMLAPHWRICLESGENPMIAPRATLKGSNSHVLRVVFSPDGKLIAAGQQDGTVKVWQVATGTDVITLPGQPVPVYSTREFVGAIAFSPSSELLAWGGGQHSIKLLDITSKRVTAQTAVDDSWINAIAFSPNGKDLAIGTNGGGVFLQNVSNKKLERIYTAEREELNGYQPGIRALAFDPSGRTLAFSSLREGYLVDLGNQFKIRASLHATDSDIVQLTFSPDGKTLAAAAQNVVLWNSTAGQKIGTITSVAKAIAYSPDGSMLAIARVTSVGDPSYVLVYDVEKRDQKLKFVGHEKGVLDISWCPDGNTFATAGTDGTVNLWDIQAIIRQAGN